MNKYILFIILIILIFTMTNLYASNDWSTNPMSIDATEDKSESYEVTAFEWHPDSTSDDLKITNAAGTTIWMVKAVASGSNGKSDGVEWRHFYTPRYLRGIYISVIDSGTLYIHKTKRSP